MAARAFDVKPLFAEPYFKTNIADAITPKQEKFIKNLKMLDNQVNKISVELYLFELPEMKSIKLAVQEALDTLVCGNVDLYFGDLPEGIERISG